MILELTELMSFQSCKVPRITSLSSETSPGEAIITGIMVAWYANESLP